MSTNEEITMQHANQTTSTTHFFDVFTAQLYLDNGNVITMGKPEDYYPDVQERSLERMERVLKKTGTIKRDDEIFVSL